MVRFNFGHCQGGLFKVEPIPQPQAVVGRGFSDEVCVFGGAVGGATLRCWRTSAHLSDEVHRIAVSRVNGDVRDGREGWTGFNPLDSLKLARSSVDFSDKTHVLLIGELEDDVVGAPAMRKRVVRGEFDLDRVRGCCVHGGNRSTNKHVTVLRHGDGGGVFHAG